MYPIVFQLRVLPWYLAAWGLAGVVLAWMLVISQTVSWTAALTFALPAVLLYGFMATSAYYVCRSLPMANRSALRVFVMFGSASLLSAIAWLSLCLLLNELILSLHMLSVGIIMTPQLMIALFCLAALAYVVSLLTHDLLIAADNIRDAELKKSAALVLARDAELQVLRSQINPHFLFNSLNSISALTAIDASAARSMVIELGNFFRKSLDLSASPTITLGEELALCEHYLAVEKIRFDNRLLTSINIDPALLSAKVPPMLLQPLVENAIKHGICNLPDGGTIEIMGAVHESWLYLTIANPLGQQTSVAVGSGTGLKNLKSRLQNVYGESVRMTWQKTHSSFRVEMIIPLVV